jgi:hypothetical protein
VDTIGDLDDNDVILAFFRQAKTYLCAKLAEAGLEATDLTIEELEDRVVSLKKANEISQEERKKPSQGSSQPNNFKNKFSGAGSANNSTRNPGGKVSSKDADGSSAKYQQGNKSLKSLTPTIRLDILAQKRTTHA